MASAERSVIVSNEIVLMGVDMTPLKRTAIIGDMSYQLCTRMIGGLFNVYTT